MPDLPISALPSLASPEPTDVFAIVNSGVTKKTTVQAVGNSVFTQISSSVVLPSQTSSFVSSNTFNSFTASVNTTTGSLTPYFGSFYHTASMLNGGINAINSMSLSTTDFAFGVSLSGSNGQSNLVKIANSGYYDIQFSAQTDASQPGNDFIIYMWLNKNGLDVPNSNTAVTTVGGSNAQTVAAWNWFVSASAGDSYQIRWASAEQFARIHYDPSPLSGPAIPSLILTVNKVG